MTKRLLFIPLFLFALSGCGLVLGTTAATTGVTLAKDKSVSDSAADSRIELQISDLWFKHSVDMFNAFSVSVSEGKVLLTGSTTKPAWRVDAVRLAWQVDGVKEVINEIKLADSAGVSGFARDAWIGTQLRTKMVFDSDIVSINYSIDVVGGTVYLMGIAQDQAELDRVFNIARNLSYVKNVVSYVRLKTNLPVQ